MLVLEGAEGVGKTTQIRRLADYLAERSIRAITVREPGGTVVGDEIRRVLLDPSASMGPRTEALLFMASRAELVERVILPQLNAGVFVIVDRFFLSTYAYQIAGRGLPAAEVRHANDLARSGLVPDLTLLLLANTGERDRRAALRGPSDRIEQAGEHFYKRVDAAFASFLDAEWQARHPESGPIVSVDAGGTEGEVFVRIIDAVAARWPEFFFARTPEQLRADTVLRRA